MTRKELINHDWKEGEILYEVGYRRYECFAIPVKVIRVKVRKILNNWIYTECTNKRDADLIGRYGYYLSSPLKLQGSDLFLTKEEAEKRFQKKRDEFRSLHSDRLYNRLKEYLNWLDSEKNMVWGIMRMKIMKD